MRTNISMPTMTFMTKYFHSSTHRLTSVHLIILNKILPAFIVLSSFFISSCEEDPTIIGKGLLPGSDFVTIKSIDTLSVWSYTMYDESVRTDNPPISYLGELYDSYFGTTTASFVTQLRLKYPWDGKPFVIDSMKLILKFSNLTGGATGSYKLNFSEISTQIYTDSAYYSNRSMPLTGYVSPDIILPKLKRDTINDLVIKLPDVSFGTRLLQDTTMLFHNNIKPDFRSSFKGLYFTLTSDTDPVLATLSLVNDNDVNGYLIADRYYKNFFVMYVHDPDGNVKSFFFIMDAINKNAAFNKFSHTFSPEIAQHVNTLKRDTLTYLQGLNGVYTRIVLPGLDSLKKNPDLKNVAINKARLTIPFYYDTVNYKKSNAPAQLFLRYRTRSGEKYIIPDYSVDQYHTFFDGMVDTVNFVYNFNLPAFVQKYMEDASGQILPELEVFQASGTKNVILKANDSKTPVKFKLIYTIF